MAVLGDIFAVLSIYGLVGDSGSLRAEDLWTLFTGSLAFILFAPPCISCWEVRKEVPIVAASEGWLELWYVRGNKTHYAKQIMWPEIDSVLLNGHDYYFLYGASINLLVEMMKIPRNYDIVLDAGPWNIVLDAGWPNAMRLLEDTLRLDPKAKGWKDLDGMRKEVEKWKSETTSAF